MPAVVAPQAHPQQTASSLWRDALPALLVGLALAVVFTWPIAAHFGSGGRLDSGDGRFSIWNVAWVAHALTSQPASVLDANIFYPSTRALAYSEPNLLAGALAAPVWLATGNPYAAANAALLLSFALSFTATFLLARYLTGCRFAALVAAMFFAFNSYVFAHLPHIQLLMTFGLPLTLLALHRFVDAPGWPRAVALGAALATQALACGYYGIFAAMTAALGLVWFGATHRRLTDARYWGLALVSALVALVIVAPLVPAFLSVKEAGLTRSLDEARIFRAGWRSYLASALLAYRWLLPYLGHWREVLFPGFVSVAFALVTLVHLARTRPARHGRAPLLLFYVAIALLAAWASTGPDGGLYRWMHDAVPFMSFVRAPARFGVLVILVFAVLGGVGVSIVDRALAGPRQRWARAAIVVVVAARSTVGPIDIAVADPPTRAAAWLQRLPRGGTAEFPVNGPGGNRHDQTYYMMQSAWHWQPLVNGYSDFTPPGFEAVMPALESFPSPAALDALRARQARYVVVNWDLYSGPERIRVRRTLEMMAPALRMMLDDAHASLYAVESTVPAS